LSVLASATRVLARTRAALGKRLPREQSAKPAPLSSAASPLDLVRRGSTRRVAGKPAPRPGRLTGDEAVSPALRTLTGYVWRVAILAFAVYVVFSALARLQTVAVAVFAGLVLCAILLPLTNLLARFLPRGLGAALSLLAAIFLVGGLLTFIGTSAANQSAQLTTQLQDGIAQITHWLNRGPLKISTADLNNAVTQAKTWISNNRGALASQALSSAGLALALLSGLVLAVFCSLFFLSSGSTMWAWVVEQLPPARQQRIDGAVSAGWTAFAGYTRGIIIVASSNAAVVALALALLRVPLALPLAVLVFFATFIPLIGAPVAMAVATLVALAGRGPAIALIVLVMIVLVGQFEGNVLHPLVMSRAVSLHPVVVALSVTSGAVLGGIVGAVIAVPVASTAWGVMKFLRDN
jgi:putative heme transporter